MICYNYGFLIYFVLLSKCANYFSRHIEVKLACSTPRLITVFNLVHKEAQYVYSCSSSILTVSIIISDWLLIKYSHGLWVHMIDFILTKVSKPCLISATVFSSPFWFLCQRLMAASSLAQLVSTFWQRLQKFFLQLSCL